MFRRKTPPIDPHMTDNEILLALVNKDHDTLHDHNITFNTKLSIIASKILALQGVET